MLEGRAGKLQENAEGAGQSLGFVPDVAPATVKEFVATPIRVKPVVGVNDMVAV